MLIDVLLSSASLQSKLPFLLSWIVALAIALTVHEFAHAKRADLAGDPTPRSQGRVSLNPLDHYDPIGTTMILLFGIGWGKPVPVNPMLFKNPRRDGIMVALWGALANLITAVVFAIPIRLGVAGVYVLPLMIIVQLNIVLAVFNLLPVGPLDGAAVLSGLLPAAQARRFAEFSARWGMLLLILVVATRLGRVLIWGPVAFLTTLLTGHLF
jgi:Zn-dependent protease